jgi:hypothetical protein
MRGLARNLTRGNELADERATGRDVILAIGENMRQSLEPLLTKTLAPSLYQVYLHSQDYDYLRTIFSDLEAEAQKLLDTELARLNRKSTPAWSRLLRKKEAEEAPAMQYVSAEGKWTIRFQEDPNGTLNPGDIEIVSEFANPLPASYGAGSKTHRISTTRKLGEAGTPPSLIVKRETVESSPAFAKLDYKDDKGAKTFYMTKGEIVIGREAPDVWVDLRLETSLDVSREHARLQRTQEGKFRIKDLSKLGTTVNGVPLPRSLEAGAAGVTDLERWSDLPDRARIGLAGILHLDFERLDLR